MFNWLTSEELTTIGMAPGETRLQKLKFIIAFFAATVAAKRARDENKKTATKVESVKSEPETVVTGGTYPLVMSKENHDALVSSLKP